jgi:hypothetical protein
MWARQALRIKTPSALLAAWIESNILLQLASAPFDKQDETLIPEAGSCTNCPKRTGFNKLLFPDVRKDSCTSPDCFRAKIDACVKPFRRSDFFEEPNGNCHILKALAIKLSAYIQTGKRIPHPRHWQALVQLVGIFTQDPT